MPPFKSSHEKDAMIVSFRGFSRSLHKRLKQWALAHDRPLEYTLNHVVREWLDLQKDHKEEETREKSRQK
jgi:hypothetical protein